MRLTLILLISSLAVAVAYQRGGGGSRSFGGGRSGGVPSRHSAPKAGIRSAAPRVNPVRHSPRIAPKPHIKPAVRPAPRIAPKPQIRPVVKAPPKVVPKPQIRPVAKAPPKINPVPKVVPKPQIKPVVKAPPKVVPKPQIKPVVKAPPKVVPKPQIKPVVKAPPKVSPVPKVVPKPQIKPVVKAPPNVSPVPKVIPKPQIKPVAKAPPKVNPAPKPAVVVKAPTVNAAPKAPVKPVPPKTPPKPVVSPPKSTPPAKAPVKPVVATTPIKLPNLGTPPKTDPKIQISGTASGSPGKGVQVNVEAKKNVWESQNKLHSVDVTASASKPFGGPQGNTKPDVNYGGQYSYNGDKTQFTASANGKPGQGVDLKAEAKQNIWESQNKRHSIDASADVSKHFGGPQGTGKKDINLGGQYSYNTDKTQITASANGKPGQGVDLSVTGKQNLWESQNKRHSIDATAEASKHMGGPLGNSKTDLNFGGQYSYGDSKTQIITSAKGAPGQGVQLGIEGKQNLFESNDKRTTVDITGGVSKQIGGPNGNGNLNPQVGIEVNTKF